MSLEALYRVKSWLSAFEHYGANPSNGWLPAGRAMGQILLESSEFSNLAPPLLSGDPVQVITGIRALRVVSEAQKYLTHVLEGTAGERQDVLIHEGTLPASIVALAQKAIWNFTALPQGSLPLGMLDATPQARKKAFLGFLESNECPVDRFLFRGLPANRLGALLAGEREHPESGGVYAYEAADLMVPFGLTQDIDPFSFPYLVCYRRDHFAKFDTLQRDFWHWHPVHYSRSARHFEETVAGVVDFSMGQVYPSIGDLRAAEAHQNYGMMVEGMLLAIEESPSCVKTIRGHLVENRSFSPFKKQAIFLAAGHYMQHRFPGGWRFHAVREQDDSYAFLGAFHALVIRGRGPFAGHILSGKIMDQAWYDAATLDYGPLHCYSCAEERVGRRPCNFEEG